MKQMTLATFKGFEVHGRATRKAAFLACMEMLVPWTALCALIESHNQRKRIKPNRLPIIHERAADIDIGSRFCVVAVSPEICDEPVQTFQAFTSDLIRMADRLIALGIKTVAMESTGVYCVAVFEVLESKGVDILPQSATISNY